MFSKKGKRKIVIEGNTYYWGVNGDNYCCPYCPNNMNLSIFSEEKYLFGMSISEEYATKYNTQIVTPAIVREII